MCIRDRDGIGIVNISTGSVWTWTGFSKLHGITGRSRIPWNPAGFSPREKSRGKSCFFSDVAPSKTKIRFPGWFHVYFFFNCFSDILKIAFSVRIARPITKIVLLCLPSDNVSYMFDADMSGILLYCSSLSPSTSVVSSNTLNQVSYFLFLKAYPNIDFPQELRRKHST